MISESEPAGTIKQFAISAQTVKAQVKATGYCSSTDSEAPSVSRLPFQTMPAVASADKLRSAIRRKCARVN